MEADSTGESGRLRAHRHFRTKNQSWLPRGDLHLRPGPCLMMGGKKELHLKNNRDSGKPVA